MIVECPDEYSIVSLVRENFGIALMPQTDILLDADGFKFLFVFDAAPRIISFICFYSMPSGKFLLCLTLTFHHISFSQG